MNSFQVASAFLEEGISEKTLNKFFDYHSENPEVWEHFEKFALEAANARRRLGAKAIIERVRWEVEINNNGEFKINNNFPAYYARLFHLKYPEHHGFFETREIKGLSAE